MSSKKSPKGKRNASPSVKRRSSTKKENFRSSTNINKGDCEWPIKNGKMKNCDFNYEILYQEENLIPDISENVFKLVIVEMPKNTKIYHGTQILGEHAWFRSQYPINTERGGIWFASTYEHAFNLSLSTHFLEYTLKDSIVLLFIQNLSQYSQTMRGYEFIYKEYKNLKKRCKELGYNLHGYVSCSECEIFIENEYIKKCLNKHPVVVSERSKNFID